MIRDSNPSRYDDFDAQHQGENEKMIDQFGITVHDHPPANQDSGE